MVGFSIAGKVILTPSTDDMTQVISIIFRFQIDKIELNAEMRSIFCSTYLRLIRLTKWSFPSKLHLFSAQLQSDSFYERKT